MTEGGAELAVDNGAWATAGEAAVPAYRFYALDGEGRILDTRDIAAEDDRCAEELAQRLLADVPNIETVEIWVRPRLVSRLANPGSAKPAQRSPSTSIESTFSG